jgi:hypothetical protein
VSVEANVVQELVTELEAQGASPLDPLHAAALLEAHGWSDARAGSLGFEDVFDLASVVHGAAEGIGPLRRLAAPEEQGVARVRSVLRSYLRGMTFALPMLLLSLSVVFLHFSIVSYVRYSVALATAIGIGTVTSFLVTGGFSQAIAHEGLFYFAQGLYTLGRHFCRRVVAVGIVTVLAAWAGVLLLNLLFQIFPWWMMGVATLFYLLLAATWLGTSLLYMLRREPTILALFAGSVAVVFLLFRLLHVPMLPAQAIAIAALDLAVFAVVGLYFRQLEAQEDPSLDLAFNRRWSAILQVIRPYFLYGLVYFAFLFVDRLVAWSAPAPYHPYLFWLQNDYELGLDWALWAFMFPMGLVEVYVDDLFRRIEKQRPLTSLEAVSDFDADFAARHRRTMSAIVVTGLLTMLAVVAVLAILARLHLLADPLANPVIRTTFLLAAPSYVLITLALLNTLLPLSLNMVEGALRSAALGLGVDLIVGFVASRLFGYPWAVLGLLAGALTFASFSMGATKSIVARLDFNLVRLL